MDLMMGWSTTTIRAGGLRRRQKKGAYKDGQQNGAYDQYGPLDDSEPSSSDKGELEIAASKELE
jgi:hypothetical protein